MPVDDAVRRHASPTPIATRRPAARRPAPWSRAGHATSVEDAFDRWPRPRPPALRAAPGHRRRARPSRRSAPPAACRCWRTLRAPSSARGPDRAAHATGACAGWRSTTATFAMHAAEVKRWPRSRRRAGSLPPAAATTMATRWPTPEATVAALRARRRRRRAARRARPGQARTDDGPRAAGRSTPASLTRPTRGTRRRARARRAWPSS